MYIKKIYRSVNALKNIEIKILQNCVHAPIKDKIFRLQIFSAMRKRSRIADIFLYKAVKFVNPLRTMEKHSYDGKLSQSTIKG